MTKRVVRSRKEFDDVLEAQRYIRARAGKVRPMGEIDTVYLKPAEVLQTGADI